LTEPELKARIEEFLTERRRKAQQGPVDDSILTEDNPLFSEDRAE
jgi:hypothetical protein